MNQYLRFYKEIKYECQPLPEFIVDVVVIDRGLIGAWTVIPKKKEYLPIVKNAMRCLPNLNDD